MIGSPLLLISDDDRAFRETLRDVFERRGFETILVCDGQAAVETVDESPVHLVLIDLHMPRLSGLEAISQIRQRRANLPCILISGSLDELEHRPSEPFSILRKPVRFRELTDLVDAALWQCYGFQ